MKIFKKFCSLMLIFTFITITLNSSALAIDVTKSHEHGDVTIQYEYKGEALEDVKFEVYQVATIDTEGEYTVTESFENKGVQLDCDELDCEDYLKALRDELMDCVDCVTVNPYYDFVTDTTGEYTIEELDYGMYYAESEKVTNDNELFFSEPILFVLNTNGITIDPKIAKEVIPEYVEVTVTKVWKNVNSDFIRPNQVEITLYGDDKKFDTIILNQKNNWTHKWTKLDPDVKWSVKETFISDDFKVDYSVTKQDNHYDFIVTNTYTDDDEEIPQTGSLANKIPLLSGAGLVLILTGVLLKTKRKNDES